VRRAAEAGQPVPVEILETVNQFRAWHLETLAAVQDRISDARGRRNHLSPTSRLKTPEAILAKLKRTPTSLMGMQDIAGARVIVDNLTVQDSTLSVITGLFPDEVIKIKDQRVESDVHGYRAIHVIMKVDGRLAEIQIRTRWQDRWAQVVERLDAAETDI